VIKRAGGVGDNSQRQARERKLRSIQERAKVSEKLTALAAKGPLSPDTIAAIDQALEAVSKQAREHAGYVDYVENDSKRLLNHLKHARPDTFKATKKYVSQYIDIGKEMHADAVNLYYFLLSLKAQFDPSATEGPSFSNPDELQAYLEAALAD
jgi:poly-D-alanine transfer protein DltD